MLSREVIIKEPPGLCGDRMGSPGMGLGDHLGKGKEAWSRAGI